MAKISNFLYRAHGFHRSLVLVIGYKRMIVEFGIPQRMTKFSRLICTLFRFRFSLDKIIV